MAPVRWLWVLLCSAALLTSCSNILEVEVLLTDASADDEMPPDEGDGQGGGDVDVPEEDIDEPGDVDDVVEDADGPDDVVEDADEPDLIEDVDEPQDVEDIQEPDVPDVPDEPDVVDEPDAEDVMEDEEVEEPCPLAYIDADGDGFGDANVGEERCEPLDDGWVRNSDDCNDDDFYSHPGAIDICDGRDNDCDGDIDQYGCQCDPFRIGDVAYTLCTDKPMNWIDARRFCQAQGGDLAIIRDEPTDLALWQRVVDTENFNAGDATVWIGMSDLEEEGVMRWVDGTPVPGGGDPIEGYSRWNSDEPNDHIDGEDCGELYGGAWNDRHCTRQGVFICEVDLGQLPRSSCDLPATFYRDVDGDGFGDEDKAVMACLAPPGFVPEANEGDGFDCDDGRPLAYPGRVEICDGDDDNCNGVIDEDCRCSYMNRGRNEYLICAVDRASWTEAEQRCQEHGYRLAYIEDQAENDELFDMMYDALQMQDDGEQGKDIWIGWNMGNGDRWTYGFEVRYTNWHTNQPDRDNECVFMENKDDDLNKHKQWADKGCGGGRPYICKHANGAPPWRSNGN